jgi:hypothetical protein
MQRLKKTLHALARSTRLQREKLVEARKVEIRAEEIARGKQALAEFIAGLNATIGKPYMPTIAADFAGAIRAARRCRSLRDAVDQELARAKIEASTVCGRIVINMRALRELAAEHAFLFADTATLVLKAEDDCRAQIDSRIAAHRAPEERRLEAERARIRAEELMRAIDLFAGAGRLQHGRAMAGCKVVWAANHWPAAVQVHANNHPDTLHVCQDLQQADWTRCRRTTC